MDNIAIQLGYKVYVYNTVLVYETFQSFLVHVQDNICTYAILCIQHKIVHNW